MQKLNQILFVGILILNSIFLSSIVFSQDINNYEYLKLEINNTVEFTISSINKPYIKTVDLTSYFFPQTIQDAQYLNSFTSNMNYSIEKNFRTNSLKYIFNQEDLKSLNQMNNKFIVESVVTRPKITSKVSYPIEDISIENQIYLEFSELINTNDQIKLQASILAEGENDVFLIASKVAKWVQEDINYDLSTITALPNQNSIQVFNTKRGVCKEITNLYISMMRSLGIPARVVSGYAWTNSEEILALVGSNWGGHAWAEVLIGDKWVPFDLTYNEYGYVDASHIVIDKYSKIRKSGVETLTTTKSTNRNLNSNIENLKIDNSFGVISKKENVYDLGFDIKTTGSDNIGFGSYGYIKVSITNKDEFYKILFLSLSRITEVQIIGKEKGMIIFKPNETKEIYFKFKLTDDLSKNYAYTFPFTIYNENLKIEHKISSQENYPKLNLEDLPQEINSKVKIYSNNAINLNCDFTIDKPLNLIVCSVKNPNNFVLKDIKICKQDSSCNLLDLNLNEEKSIIFKTSNFNETISIEYDKLINKINVEFKKPKIIYEKKLSGNILDLNTLILNFDKNTILNIYINGKFIKQINKNEENSQIKLRDESNLIKLELKYKHLTFENLTFNQTVDPKFVPNVLEKKLEDISNNKESIYRKIIKFFSNFFRL